MNTPEMEMVVKEKEEGRMRRSRRTKRIGKMKKSQRSPKAFSLDPLSARSLEKSARARERVSLGDVTAHGRVQD